MAIAQGLSAQRERPTDESVKALGHGECPWSDAHRMTALGTWLSASCSHGPGIFKQMLGN